MSTALVVPVKPMLAETCKACSKAFEKCKSQIMYAEIKYDGERVQIHYDDTKCKFYSHSSKPVQEYKIDDVQQDITRACPNAKTLILHSEILVINTRTGKPVPFVRYQM